MCPLVEVCIIFLTSEVFLIVRWLNKKLANSGEDEEEPSALEVFEDNFADALENATQKNLATRLNALQALGYACTRRYVPEMISGR